MATEVTIPILHGDTATTQRVDVININLKENIIEINIVDSSETGTLLYNTRKVFPIWNDLGVLIIPANIAQEAKDLHVAITAAAKAQGWIGDGVTTDDLV